ncbi:cupin domain-containing protein [Candidatus Daviesbacteria bacterium]|nr:cupin domain-containing protein [Candidatus Daviesbacteria bacterium]
MNGYITDIEDTAKQNENFRQVLFTAPKSQLVVMSLKPGEDIGEEVHEVDQFIRIEEGEGKVILNGEESPIPEDTAIVIPSGTRHNIINTSAKEKLKLYTIYSPAEHKDSTIHSTKADALADTEDHL